MVQIELFIGFVKLMDNAESDEKDEKKMCWFDVKIVTLTPTCEWSGSGLNELCNEYKLEAAVI